MGKCFRSAFLSIVSVKRDFHVARQRDLEAKPSPLTGCSVWEVPDAESESEQVRTVERFITGPSLMKTYAVMYSIGLGDMMM